MKWLRPCLLALGFYALAMPLRAETLNDDLQPDPGGSYSYTAPESARNGSYLIEVHESDGTLYARLTNSAPRLGEGHLTGPITFYYPSGRLKEQRPVDAQGRIDGQAQRWYDDGSLMARVPYVKGQKDGLETRYNRAGDVTLKYHWKDDRLNGLQSSYYASGQLEREVMRQDGHEVGTEKMYYADGKPQATVTWKDGWRDGPYRGYSDKGYLTETGTYANGSEEGLQTTYWPNGQKREAKHRHDGRTVGASREWRKDGSLRAQTDYDADGHFRRERRFAPGGAVRYLRVPVTVEGHGKGEKIVETEGHVIRTHIKAGNYALITKTRNGKLLDRSEMIDHQFIGLSIQTSEIGQIRTEAHYDNGALNGEWIRSWRGKLLDKGMYDHDKRVGKWQRVAHTPEVIHEFYDDHGKLDGTARTLTDWGDLIKLATYDHGVLDGPYKELHKGKLRTAGTYVDGRKSGPWREADHDKPVTRVGHYQSGAREGTWQVLNQAGYVIEQADYAHDQREGPSYRFREDGGLARMEDWHGGKRDGYATDYDDNGPTERALWRDGKRLRGGLKPADGP